MRLSTYRGCFFSLRILGLASSSPLFLIQNYSRQQTVQFRSAFCQVILLPAHIFCFNKSSMQEPKSSPAQGSIFAMTPKLNADVKVTSTGMSQELVKSNCLPFSICTYHWPFPLGLYRRPPKRDTGSHVYSPVAGWRACRVHRPRLLNRLTPLMVFALVVVERRIH